MITHHPTSLVG